MKIIKDLEYIKNSCVGLGFFDGVHIGHKKLLETLTSQATKYNTSSVVVTFKNSPAEIFSKNVEYLTTLSEREQLIEMYNIDYMIELDFDENLKNITAEDYLENILVKYLSPIYIVSGFNHTFGKGKVGNPEFLKEQQKKYNYKYEEIPSVKINEEIISSTKIKQYLHENKIEEANKLLGRNYSISGTVIRGNQIGRKIGFPTANIDYPEKKVKISNGAYKAVVTHNGQTYTGLLNYGYKPTVSANITKPVAEVHIIGFNKDIYGENIEISVIKKIRDEKRFNSTDELKQQIIKDKEICLE